MFNIYKEVIRAELPPDVIARYSGFIEAIYLALRRKAPRITSRSDIVAESKKLLATKDLEKKLPAILAVSNYNSPDPTTLKTHDVLQVLRNVVRQNY